MSPDLNNPGPEISSLYDERTAILDQAPFTRAFFDDHLHPAEANYRMRIAESGISGSMQTIVNIGWKERIIDPLVRQALALQIFHSEQSDVITQAIIEALFLIGFETGEKHGFFLADTVRKINNSAELNETSLDSQEAANNTMAFFLNTMRIGSQFKSIEQIENNKLDTFRDSVNSLPEEPLND